MTLTELRNSLATTLGGDKYISPQLWGYALAAAYQRDPNILRSIDVIPDDSRHPFMTRSQELGNTQTPIFRAEVERQFPIALAYLRRHVEDLLKARREELSKIEETCLFDQLRREIWLTTAARILEEQSTKVALITDVGGVKDLFHCANEARISCLAEKGACLKSGKTPSELVTHAIVVTRNEAGISTWESLTYFLENTLIRTYSI